MASDEIAKELGDAAGLLASQMSAGLPREDVLEALFRAWSARLASPANKFSSKQKSLLTDAINSGPWTKEQTMQLAGVVLSNGTAAKASKGSARTQNQKIDKPENLVTAELALKMKDKTTLSLSSRCSMFASFMNKLGVFIPDEASLFKMTKLVAWWEQDFEKDQQEVFKIMDMLGRYIKTPTRIKDLPYLERFPDNANMLPEAIQASAYQAADVPPEVDIPELASILGANKMRGRVKKDPEWLQNVPSEYRHAINKKMLSEGQSPPHSPRKDATARQPLPSPEVLRFGSHAAISPSPLENEPAVKTEPLCSQCQEKVQAPMTDACESLEKFERELIAAGEIRKGAPKTTGSMKRPAAKKTNPGVPNKLELILGCSKCKRCHLGCAQCRNPNFGGQRGPLNYSELPMKAMKTMKPMKTHNCTKAL
jgi:ribosomal protein L44E